MIVIIAHYTSTPINVLESLPFPRLLVLADRVTKVREREDKQQWARAAFVGWQVVSALGAKVSFRDYLRKIGLGEGLRG